MTNRIYIRFPVESRQIMAVLNREHPATLVIFTSERKGTCVNRNLTMMSLPQLLFYYGMKDE